MAKLNTLTTLMLLLVIHVVACSADNGAMVKDSSKLGIDISISFGHQRRDCTIDVNLKTGDVDSAGTDAKVALVLYDWRGVIVANETDLQTKGTLGPEYDYFERNSTESFRLSSACNAYPVCKIRLSHNNDKPYAGWYISYVEVINCRGGKNCIPKKFKIDQWLALDEDPKSLSLERNQCHY